MLAINEIKRRGHGLLAEFEIVDGETKRKQVRRLIAAATDLFTGGITELEAAIVRGEKPTWKQIGFAALDVAIVVGGASAVVKSVRAAKVLGKGAVIARTGTAVRTIATVGKIAAAAGATTVLVAVATNPALIASAAGWIAEQAGLPAWVGVLALAMIAAGLVMFLIELLTKYILWPITYPYRLGMRFVAYYRRRHPKQT